MKAGLKCIAWVLVGILFILLGCACHGLILPSLFGFIGGSVIGLSTSNLMLRKLGIRN